MLVYAIGDIEQCLEWPSPWSSPRSPRRRVRPWSPKVVKVR